jgi:predicted secreted protein
MQRRSFLNHSVKTGMAVIAINAGLLSSTKVLANWQPNKAFTKHTIKEAITALYGQSSTIQTHDIILKILDYPPDGDRVAISIDATHFPDVESIAIFADKHAEPLIANYHFKNGALGYVDTQINLRWKKQNIIVVVKANGKLYQIQKIIDPQLPTTE